MCRGDYIHMSVRCAQRPEVSDLQLELEVVVNHLTHCWEFSLGSLEGKYVLFTLSSLSSP